MFGPCFPLSLGGVSGQDPEAVRVRMAWVLPTYQPRDIRAFHLHFLSLIPFSLK